VSGLDLAFGVIFNIIDNASDEVLGCAPELAPKSTYVTNTLILFIINV